LFDSF
jgi:hypothetical protein